MTDIVKVQRPLATNDPCTPWLIYAVKHKHRVSIPQPAIPPHVKKQWAAAPKPTSKVLGREADEGVPAGCCPTASQTIRSFDMGEETTWLFAAPGEVDHAWSAECHAPFDALYFATGPILLRRKYINGDRVTLNARDATEMLGAFARRCALDVIHLWDAPDIVRKWLEIGDSALREAAGVPANDAVWSVDASDEPAWAAAWAAVWAADSPVWDAVLAVSTSAGRATAAAQSGGGVAMTALADQRGRLNHMASALFEESGE